MLSDDSIGSAREHHSECLTFLYAPLFLLCRCDFGEECCNLLVWIAISEDLRDLFGKSWEFFHTLLCFVAYKAWLGVNNLKNIMMNMIFFSHYCWFFYYYSPTQMEVYCDIYCALYNAVNTVNTVYTLCNIFCSWIPLIGRQWNIYIIIFKFYSYEGQKFDGKTLGATAYQASDCYSMYILFL